MSRSCADGQHDKCRANAMVCDCNHHKADAFTRMPTGVTRSAVPVPALVTPAAHVERAPGKYKPVVALAWEDPPDPNIGNSTHAEVAKLLPELRRNPGKWARLLVYRSGTGAGTSSTTLKKRFTDIEFTTRRLETGSAVYGRFTEPDDG